MPGLRQRAASRASQAERTMSSTVCRICQLDVAGRQPALGDDDRRVAGATRLDVGGEVDAGHPGGRLHDLADRQPVSAAQVVDRLQRAPGVQHLGRRHVGGGEIGHVHVVADAGAVRGRVVVTVDVGDLPRDQLVEDDREQVVRAGVAQLRGARADHVEVAQRRVRERGRLGLIAQQPLPDQLRLPVRRLRPGRALLGDQVGVRGAVDRGAGGEDDPLDAVCGHPLQQDDRAGDVLGVGVQRATDRDAGVLEAGQVHDTTDVAPVEGLVDRGPVDQGADHQRHVRRDETPMATGQIVQHHAVDALVPERPHHVRADVAGPAGHQPSHGPTLSSR